MHPIIHFHIHGNGEFDPAHPIPPCIWPHFDLLCVHTGHLCLTIQGQTEIELRDRQAVLLYPRTLFAGRSVAARSTVSVMHFGLEARSAKPPADASPLDRLLNRAEGFELYPRPMRSSLQSDIRRAVTFAHAPPSPFTRTQRESLLGLILCQFWADHQTTGPAAGAHDAVIDFPELLKWLTARLDKPASLDEMAEFTGLSTSHFRAVFTRHMKRSPGHFMRHTRQVEAARLLRETRLPIKEIARRTGFDDLGHFYRFFAQFSDQTPKDYRRRNQPRG